ncbi:MAG: hypothetical protein R3A10_09385 [Caldilineaceae bacterium]
MGDILLRNADLTMTMGEDGAIQQRARDRGSAAAAFWASWRTWR